LGDIIGGPATTRATTTAPTTAVRLPGRAHAGRCDVHMGGGQAGDEPVRYFLDR
jgi:hypothetical protein